MQLPQYDANKKRKRVKKICKHPGCMKEFIGHPIAKYCEEHRDAKIRLKYKNEMNKNKEKLVDENNLTFSHSFREVVVVEFACSYKGCNKKYRVKIFPQQFKYPKYCEEHRNEYKRLMPNGLTSGPISSSVDGIDNMEN